MPSFLVLRVFKNDYSLVGVGLCGLFVEPLHPFNGGSVFPAR